jgi:hypothetical protein
MSRKFWTIRTDSNAGGKVGDRIGWTCFYLLADGCFLDLQMDPKAVGNGPEWGGNGLLRSVSIQSNGVKMVSITLTSPLPQEPERVSESAIRQKIPGTWSAKKFEGGTNSLTLTFGADGAVEVRRPDSTVGRAAWRTGNDGWVIVTPEKNALSSNSLDFWEIWHLDDHELAFRRGWSTAGPPERFTR